MKFFINEKVYDYEGPRDAAGIVSYMEERAAPGWKPPPEAVVELGDADFDEYVKKQELALVEFFAPWCGHCKQLAPQYEKAAKQLLQHDPPIPLIKVDATKATDLGKRFAVSGYPTLKIFRNGKESEYNGPREEAGIVQYMGKQYGDACKEAFNVKDIQSSLSLSDTSLVGFFEHRDVPLYTTYQEAGNDLRENYTMLYTLDEAARKKYGVKANSVVVLQPERFATRDDEKSRHMAVISNADASVEELQEFYRDNELPLVGELSSDTVGLRYYRRPLCVFFVTVDWSHDYRDMTQAWRRKFLRVGKKFSGKVTFAMADEDKMKTQFDEFGFGDSGSDFNLGCYDRSGAKFPLEPQDDFETDDIEEFIEDFLAGKAKPYFKSQIPPKKQKGPVVVVVGKTFHSIVMDNSKDVLIELYAPWCGHCKKFEPEYKKLAKELKSESSLVIAKIDATANDVPSPYQALGFPTIYLAPAGDKQNPVKYSGQRELDDLRKFIRENSKATKRDEL